MSEWHSFPVWMLLRFFVWLCGSVAIFLSIPPYLKYM